MPTTEMTVHVAAPPSAVWDALAVRFDAIKTWGKLPGEVELSGTQPTGLGTTRVIQAPGVGTLTETIVCFEDERHLAYEIRGLEPLLREARSDWLLTPEDGGTKVHLVSRSEAGMGVFGKVLTTLLGPVMSRPVRALPKGLKRYVEAEVAAG